MPIYAYRCGACGHAKDILQKLSDPLLTQCPACGAQAFAKQVTAAGFQLKGSGWYVTDFRDGGKAAKAADAPAAGADAGAPGPANPAATPDAAGVTKPAAEPAAKSTSAASGVAATPAATPAAPAPGPAPAPSRSSSSPPSASGASS